MKITLSLIIVIRYKQTNHICLPSEMLFWPSMRSASPNSNFRTAPRQFPQRLRQLPTSAVHRPWHWPTCQLATTCLDSPGRQVDPKGHDISRPTQGFGKSPVMQNPLPFLCEFDSWTHAMEACALALCVASQGVKPTSSNMIQHQWTFNGHSATCT